MNHIFCSVKLSILFFLVFVLFFLGCWWGNNEAEGTCFLLGLNSPLYQPITRVRARWCFLEGLQTPAELSHPLSSLLPAPWWVVASWPYCPRSADKHWKLEGTFQPSTPSSPTTCSFFPSFIPLQGSPSHMTSSEGCQIRGWNKSEEVNMKWKICEDYFMKWALVSTVWTFQEATTVMSMMLP